MDTFDDFPPAIRQRLRDSPYNLCAECILEVAGFSSNELLHAIEAMEAAIRMFDEKRKDL
jgi:hypothetical protein